MTSSITAYGLLVEVVGYRNFKGSGITELLPGLSNVENVTNEDKNVTIFSPLSTSLLYVERKQN